VSNRGQVKRAALSLLVSSWSFGRCSASETAFSSYSFILLDILVGMKRNQPAIERGKKKKSNKQLLLLNKAKQKMHNTCQSTKDSTASPAENERHASQPQPLKKRAFQRYFFLYPITITFREIHGINQQQLKFHFPQLHTMNKKCHQDPPQRKHMRWKD
jgi:hypothetical protein